jgi:hypothetical protein
MKINDKCKFVLKDIYSYDIPSCHYNILKHLGHDISGIDPDNKLERNIAIGKMMKNNPRLTTLLRTTTQSLIDLYLSKNHIEKDNIILRQYDGVILNKPMTELNIGQIPLEFRNYFDIFISSINKRSFIAKDFSKKKISIKGVSSRYEAMDEIYGKFCDINFSNKTSIFVALQKIKDGLMKTENAHLFAVPTREDRYNVYLKEYGELEISKSVINIMDTDDIDRERYYNFYILPFAQSVVFQYVR